MSTNFPEDDDELSIRQSVEPSEYATLQLAAAEPADPLDAHDELAEAADKPLGFRSGQSTDHVELTDRRLMDRDEANSPVMVDDLPETKPRVIVPRFPQFAPLAYSTSRTGFVYDASMRFHVDQSEDNADAHPERPGRILQIFDEFVANGLIPRPLSQEPEVVYHLKRIIGREATFEELRLIHTAEHVDKVRASEGKFRLHVIR